ncbi:MAG: flavodoxin family protein [Candidatus Syntrophoarchaeum sp. WYZ-LMO15]|nr:MAG: flavodoxin family protein [Candidatus Syntrophoarchaeum sp. WYZ-LMO15]
MSAYILGINGSPRKGNTYAMLKAVLSEASARGAVTELVNLGDYEIRYCMGHPKEVCEKGCPLDDGFGEIAGKLIDADCIIIGSPTFMGDVSGILKNFIDRTVHLRRIGFKLRDKVGVGLVVGAHTGGGQDLALRTIHTFFLKHNMLVVSEGEPSSQSGVIAVAREVGEVEKDDTVMKECRRLGERVVEVLRMLGR